MNQHVYTYWRYLAYCCREEKCHWSELLYSGFAEQEIKQQEKNIENLHRCT